MKKSYILFFVGFSVVLNVFCWREVFELEKPHNLKVVFFDVGQGDSVFIETPQGHQIIIDGGPNSVLLQKVAEQMPFWDRTIDLIILTHPEKDHMTGLIELMQRYKIDYFLWTGVVKNNAENKKLAEILKKAQNPPRQNFLIAAFLFSSATKVVTAVAGEEISAGQALIDILYPFENLSGKEPKNTNDTSVVSRLIFGKNSFLFTGDISSALEKKLVDKKSDLASDVLKVAHHGSKYSTSEIFLENAKPEIAVISVGVKNTYGHPTPEVLQRLDNFGVKTLRTDQKGDITILSDGGNLKVINNN